MFLSNLIQASVQGSLLILVLFLGLKLVPAVSPKFRLWLWRLVFLKLAFSLLPLGAISLKVLPPTLQASEESISSSLTDAEPSPDSTPTPGRSHEVSWVMAWVAGATVAGIFTIWRARSLQEAIENSRSPADATIASTVHDFVVRLRIHKDLRVMISPDVPTAVVMGARRPTILLPEEMEASEDLRLILAHEVAHVAHRDLEWNAFASLVESLFFFHPLVWLAAGSANQAQEAAADAAAIRLTNTSPKRYGEMLMRATLFSPKQPAGALSVGASTSRIRTRLEGLRHVNAKPTFAKILAAGILSIAVIAMTPAYQLSARAAQTTPPPARTITTSERLALVQRKHAKRPHSRTRRPKSGTYTFRTRNGVRTFRMRKSGRIAVSPVGHTVTISLEPQVARGVSAAIAAAEPAKAVSIAAAPRAATAAGILVPQRGGGRSYARPARAVSIAPQAAVAGATEVSVASAPSSSAPTSVSVSTSPEPAVATGVSIATAPRAISIGAAPAIATSPRAVSGISIAVAPAAAVSGRRAVKIRKGKSIGHGRSYSSGSSSGTGRSSGAQD